VKSAYAGLAEAIGRDRIAMAKAAGARVVVTSCPWCEQNLRECQGEAADVTVMDLVDVVERSLSETGVRRSGKRR
jgi:Fe-S oxidoreductase